MIYFKSLLRMRRIRKSIVQWTNASSWYETTRVALAWITTARSLRTPATPALSGRVRAGKAYRKKRFPWDAGCTDCVLFKMASLPSYRYRRTTLLQNFHSVYMLFLIYFISLYLLQNSSVRITRMSLPENDSLRR